MDQAGCLACDLTNGRQHLPGGEVHRTAHWVVEHCVGPLGVGTLVVKPLRHVTHVAELTGPEAHELGPLLRLSSHVVTQLVRPDQVYVCLWSHAGATPGHIHFVVQPVTEETVQRFGAHGPSLQAAMFAEAAPLPEDDVRAFARRARDLFPDRAP